MYIFFNYTLFLINTASSNIGYDINSLKSTIYASAEVEGMSFNYFHLHYLLLERTSLKV